MKLELKHIAPYLPYKLKCQTKDKGETVVSELNAAYSDNSYTFMNIVESEKGFEEIKPILRPLSNLKDIKDELIDANEFYDSIKISRDGTDLIFKGLGFIDDYYNTDELPYNIMQVALKNHFDVFGLIEKGLAIDINTL